MAILHPNDYISGGRAIEQTNFQEENYSKRAAYPQVGQSPARPLEPGLGGMAVHFSSETNSKINVSPCLVISSN